MLEMFFSLMIMSMMMIFFTENALIFALLVVVFSIFGSFIMSLMSFNWVFIAIILMFLGGMMVVFIYASSMSISKKNIWLWSWKKTIFSLISLSLIIMSLNMMTMKINSILPMSLFMTNSSYSMIFIAFYLLLALLLLIKIIRVNEGPLKL